MSHVNEEFKTKKCSKCGEVLPMNQEYFYKSKNKDGYENECKKCRNNWTEWKTINKRIIAKEGYKVCKICKEELPATNEYFSKHSGCYLGIDNRCKKCVANHLKEYTNNNAKIAETLIFDESITKVCDKCNQEKPATPEFFNLRKDTAKLRNTCKDCQAKNTRKYYNENKKELRIKAKEYVIKNQDKVKAYRKQRLAKWKADNADLIKQRQQQYLANKERKKEELRKWKEENPELIKAKKYEQYRKTYLKYKTEINAKHRETTNKYNAELVKWNCTTLQELGQYEEIRQDPDNPELGQVQCAKCKKWINITNMKIRARMGAIRGYSYGSSFYYCSLECQSNCSWYNQTLYPKGHIIKNYRPEQYELRKMVLERDNYECQICGKGEDESELHCHHIEGINFNPIESADIDACITLCKNCHKQVHKLPNCSYNDLRCK